MNKVSSRLYTLSCVIAVGLVLMHSDSARALNVQNSQIESLKSQFLPPEYRNTNFTIDDIKKIFEEKCKKASGTYNATLYKEIEVAANTFTTCISSLANVTALEEEITAARPLGELDTVFHKYCLKAPELEKCLTKFNEKVQPCLTKDERQQNAILMRVVKTLIGFMCSKGGDQMALFVAEEGPECFEANKEAITNCANSSFAEYWPKDGKMPDLLNLSEFVLSPEHCVDFERFEKCTLHHLEQCQEITPANIAESMFKFVKNETSCRTWIDAKANQRSVLKDPKAGGAPSLRNISCISLLSSIFFIVVCNFRLWNWV